MLSQRKMLYTAVVTAALASGCRTADSSSGLQDAEAGGLSTDTLKAMASDEMEKLDYSCISKDGRYDLYSAVPSPGSYRTLRYIAMSYGNDESSVDIFSIARPEGDIIVLDGGGSTLKIDLSKIVDAPQQKMPFSMRSKAYEGRFTYRGQMAGTFNCWMR